ncbi:MAG: phospho-sugar mutase [Actinomycetaceae bacterium]|nr:phospho-sugar mutase [Actinomycetaceae bacterium]
MNNVLFHQALEWAQHDPDPKDQKELLALIDRARQGSATALEDLTQCMKPGLTFGTAGLRATMQPGPYGMNTAVVIRATWALSRVLARGVEHGDWAPNNVDNLPGSTIDSNTSPRHNQASYRVIIAYDARHRSRDFAHTAAGVITASGGTALLFDKPCPTPVAAFALRHMKADAAIVITASHNPANDNGYKVYFGSWCRGGSGRQIIPPWDSIIHQQMENAGHADRIAVAPSGWHCIDDSVVASYQQRIVDVLSTPSLSYADIATALENLHKDASTRDAATFPQSLTHTTHCVAAPCEGTRAKLRIVYTPLHGVGADTALEVLDRCGFHDIHCVDSQREPDPDFPTVNFPNPEEQGALDLAFNLADRVNADIVIANDPDADRCCVGARGHGGVMRQLSGDQCGAILGFYAITRWLCSSRQRMTPHHLGNASQEDNPTVVRSFVSSSFIDEIARRSGLRSAVTLTGFKWISRVTAMIYGYEEALGYCCDPYAVADKDGMSAAAMIADVACLLKGEGKTLWDLLDELAIHCGVYESQPLTLRFSQTSHIDALMAKLRDANGISYLGDHAITHRIDYRDGYGDFPPSNAIEMHTSVGDRIIIRPSGTEPKLKCYLHTVRHVDTTPVTCLRQEAIAHLTRLANTLEDSLESILASL